MKSSHHNNHHVPLSGNRLLRLLVGAAGLVALITVYASIRGPDCSSGTTDAYSPDLRRDQLHYLDKHFPGVLVWCCVGFLRFRRWHSLTHARTHARYIKTSCHKEDFGDRLHADEQLLQMLRVADTSPFGVPPRRRVFLDVGAHVGAFSFAVFENWCVRAHSTSVEIAAEQSTVSVATTFSRGRLAHHRHSRSQGLARRTRSRSATRCHR